ncbi:ferredoxin--NADP reductase [Amycolatopsis magusensis]|uniref:ferredoxin--NADP reductase n=1 Tax=Amycolatopsis magusensis TaxID=882444 RepID=UPI0024A8FD54|nr:ferredoxin--NADP reductase [Amycolatopsis magusensis]MDI5977719.1 ferredoxin--NADP reductase [Amycolatopsis magusensis]
MSEARRLRVADVIAETADAHSLVFEPAPGMDYRPGQFLTLRVPSDRCGSVARCYSLSSSPHTGDPLTVTVKRTGYASNWICDNIRAGAEIEVLPPSGVFCPPDLDADLLLFAAGSGITPVMSIVKSVLAKGTGRLLLVYANRDEQSVIFARELRELSASMPDRLTVVHWLESVQGLPSIEQLQSLAAPFPGRPAFLCGPKPFMAAAQAALKALDWDRKLVHIEKFLSLYGNPFEEAAEVVAEESADPPATVHVDLDGEQRSLLWPRERKLLDLLLDAGFAAPYSCRAGQCSACACRLVSGRVKMLNNEVLDSDDLEEGIVLACQSVPLTDEVSVTYE